MYAWVPIGSPFWFPPQGNRLAQIGSPLVQTQSDPSVGMPVVGLLSPIQAQLLFLANEGSGSTTFNFLNKFFALIWYLLMLWTHRNYHVSANADQPVAYQLPAILDSGGIVVINPGATLSHKLGLYGTLPALIEQDRPNRHNLLSNRKFLVTCGIDFKHQNVKIPSARLCRFFSFWFYTSVAWSTEVN